MASTYLNDLRIEEQAQGENSGSWGNKVNSAFSQIAEAFSYGTKQLAADSDETFTMPDGTSDGTRSLYLKITSAGSLTATRTVTLGPNTVSKLWIIENATTGSQSITIAQGSGSTVTIPTGAVKMVYSDGAGSGAAVVDALTDVYLASVDHAAFGDNKKAIFGAGSDLQIYHDGSNSYIVDSGDGYLLIRGAAQLRLSNADGSQNYFVGVDSAQVELTYSGTKKFETTSTGIDVTGTVSADGLTVDGTATISGAATAGFVTPLLAKNPSTNAASAVKIGFDAGGTTWGEIGSAYNSNDPYMAFFVRSGSEKLRITDAGNVGIGTSSPVAKLHVHVPEASLVGVSNGIRIQGDTNDYGLNIGATASIAQIQGMRGDTTSLGYSDIALQPNGGNVGIGVTPSAWSTVTALQVGNAHVGALVDNAYFGANCYYDGGNWRYIATNEASRVELTSGEVQFWNAPSGTAGSVLSQTQAMTLDASGRLSINTTAATELLNIANTSGNGAGVEFAGNGNTVGSTSAFYGQGSGNDAYVWNRANSTLLFGTNNTERMRMFSNGDVSLGTSSRTFAATDRTCFEISGADNSLFALSDTAAGSLENRFYIHNDRGNSLITYLSQSGFSQRWYAGGSERMRLTNNGYLKAQANSVYIDTTGLYHELGNDAAGVLLYARNSNASGYGIILNLNNSNNTQYFFNGYSNSAGATRIIINTSGNIYNTNGTYGTYSDIKLKQDVVDAASQWDDIKDLRVRKFRMKDDPDGPLQLGLIAQEVEETSPGLVEEMVDRDSENNELGTTTKAVKYSIVYMKAVKALQEAMDRIEALEAKVAQLEGAN